MIGPAICKTARKACHRQSHSRQFGRPMGKTSKVVGTARMIKYPPDTRIKTPANTRYTREITDACCCMWGS